MATVDTQHRNQIIQNMEVYTSLHLKRIRGTHFLMTWNVETAEVSGQMDARSNRREDRNSTRHLFGRSIMKERMTSIRKPQVAQETVMAA